MSGREDIAARLKAHRVKLIAKSQSPLMRIIDRLLRLIGNRHFIDHYWTTIARRVYYPTLVTDPLAHGDVLEHELVHVRQWARWNLLFWFTYLLVPLPFGLAWFRWYWEREAYLIQLRRASDRNQEIERIVHALWTDYGWTWPRPWMRRWFHKTVASWDPVQQAPNHGPLQ